jgi:hypothetical protein
MNQEKIKFCITSDGEGVNVDVEGGARDLIDLLASVVSENEDIEMVITMALLAIHLKREDKTDDDMLSEMFSKIKPTAQA